MSKNKAILSIIAAVCVCTLSRVSYVSAVSKADLLQQKINAYRASQGIAPLKTSTTLTLVAKERARQMFTYGSFTHGSAYVKTYRQLLAPYAFKISLGGENLARNTKTTDVTLRLWHTSAGHAKLLDEPRFTHVGIAVVYGAFMGKNTTITVAVFGKKSS